MWRFKSATDPDSCVSSSSSEYEDVYSISFMDLLPDIVPSGRVRGANRGLRFPEAFAQSAEGKVGGFHFIEDFSQAPLKATTTDEDVPERFRCALTELEELAGPGTRSSDHVSTEVSLRSWRGSLETHAMRSLTGRTTKPLARSNTTSKLLKTMPTVARDGLDSS